jgi:hypothetical protein
VFLPFTRGWRENQFWTWFQNNSQRLQNFKEDRETIFEALRTELHRVDKNLTFEFGPIAAGRREFIVSADGIRSAFPSVLSLVARVPSMTDWNIIAFRPPKSLELVLEIQGLRLGADDLFFEAFQTEGRIALALYIRGFDEERRALFSQAAFILLDCALGEYAVETAVGGLDFRRLPEDFEDLELLPFRDIRSVFDAVKH